MSTMTGRKAQLQLKTSADSTQVEWSESLNISVAWIWEEGRPGVASGLVLRVRLPYVGPFFATLRLMSPHCNSFLELQKMTPRRAGAFSEPDLIPLQAALLSSCQTLNCWGQGRREGGGFLEGARRSVQCISGCLNLGGPNETQACLKRAAESPIMQGCT